MEIKKKISVFNDSWLMNEPDLNYCAENFKNVAANKVRVGLFSELPLPHAPANLALIPVVGPMIKADLFGNVGTSTLTRRINDWAIDDSKDAIILYFESVPGGQVDGTEIFAKAIKAASLKKPVIATISGMCCGSGMWAASQATEIFATSLTDFMGGIGLVVSIKNPAKANDDIVDVVSDLSPDKNKEYRDPQVLKNMYLNPIASLFQDAVKEGRGNKLKAVGKVLTGGTFIAADAKKNGLIDGIMTFEKVVLRANYLSKK